MNKLLTISLALLFSAFLNAQGTLQFDKVIFEEFTQATNSGSSEQITSSQFTIGANQVAKLVSCSWSEDGTDNIAPYSNYWLELNNMVIVGNEGHINFPVWLDEGTYTISMHNYSSSSSYLIVIQYSIIVFNVIP